MHEFYDDPDLIPAGTTVKVVLSVKPGGYVNPDLGLTDPAATKSRNSDAVYLNTAYIVLEGEYKGNAIYDLIGLYSPKGDAWARMGRKRIRDILEACNKKLAIEKYQDLDGLEFNVVVGIEVSPVGEKNTILKIVKPLTNKTSKRFARNSDDNFSDDIPF